MEQLPKIQKASDKEYWKILTIDSLTLGSDRRKDFLLEAIHKGNCYFTDLDNEIAGFAIYSRSFFDQWFIDLLVVHPDSRRKGIATAFIKHIENDCRGQKLFTSTNQSNIVAQALYETNGFRKSGCIENLDAGDPEIIYFKHL